VRFAAAVALMEQGLPGSALTVEASFAQLGTGKLDLVVQFDDAQAVFELRYPRRARGPISPDTMTLGEMLKDFYRRSRLTADSRWIVQLIRPKLLGYLNRVQRRYPLIWMTEIGQAFSCIGQVVLGLRCSILQACRRLGRRPYARPSG
jgi:hypothetical protein